MRTGIGLILLASLVAALAWTLRPAQHGTVVQQGGGLPFEALFETAGAFPDPPAIWDYRFPRDHGAHSDQFGEYWLVSGRLSGPGLPVQGFHLAFSRLSLAPGETAFDSAWTIRQLYRAQFVIDGPRPADTAAEERFSRDALALAGSAADGVWLEDWSLRRDPACDCFALQAAANGFRLALTLERPDREPVRIAGIPGLDIGEPGIHGYWWPGLAARGHLHKADQVYAVTGETFLEQFWGRSIPVARGQMSLNRLWWQSDDGAAVRCLQLRRRGGGGIPLGNCLLVAPDGELHTLHRNDLRASVPDADRLPVEWTLQLPAETSTLDIEPLRAQSPLDFRLPSWSGLVQARGGPPSAGGWGWLELSGY